MSQENEIEADRLTKPTDFLPSDAAACSAWIPITERLPKIGKKVIVCGTWTRTGSRWVSTARWQPAETIDAEMWEQYPEGWEENDLERVTNPDDLWLEEGIELEQYGFLENVTHWLPLPSLPNVQSPPTGAPRGSNPNSDVVAR